MCESDDEIWVFGDEGMDQTLNYEAKPFTTKRRPDVILHNLKRIDWLW